MKYDLIALDLDGTALSSNNQVQASTRTAVQWARSLGLRVIVSTGRIAGEAEEYATQMGADSVMITASGAAVFDSETKEFIQRTPIVWQTAVRAAAILERACMTTMVYVGEDLTLTPFSEGAFNRYKSNEGYLSSKKVVPSVAEYIAETKQGVDKLFCRCPNPVILAQARKQLEELTGVRVLSSASDNLEVLAPRVSKGDTLTWLCSQMGISMDRVIAMGDSENDLEMLSVVGMPVAMGNASEEVKQMCQYISADHNHGGVAQAIYDLLANGD